MVNIKSKELKLPLDMVNIKSKELKLPLDKVNLLLDRHGETCLSPGSGVSFPPE